MSSDTDLAVAAALDAVRALLADLPRLTRHWREHVGPVDGHLSFALAPASPRADAELANAEERLGISVPGDLRALYRRIGGFALLFGEGVESGEHAWPGTTERYLRSGYTCLLIAPPTELRVLPPGDLVFGWIANVGFVERIDEGVAIRPESKSPDVVLVADDIAQWLEAVAGVGFVVSVES